MTEILITSSVLILALLVLRKLFRNSLSRRVQYALWGLVLLRLLAPVSLPAVDFSVLTAAKPVEQTVTQRVTARPIYVPVARAPLAERSEARDMSPERADIPEGETMWLVATDETAVQYKRLSAQTVLAWVGLTGSAAAAAWLLAVNARFWLRLRRSRIPWEVEDCALPVYLVETGLSSPCLFGLCRPAIYLTPAALASPERLRYVLAHESTHARHLDHLWTLLRGVCLTVYWFDPLVWIASAAVKTDCELACDEGTLARLEEEDRIPYGQTLLSLIPVRRTVDPMLAATTMAAGKKQLKDRITRIAQKPRQLAAAAVAVALLAGLVSACTFTGAVSPAGPDAPDNGPRALTGEELRWFTEVYFNDPGFMGFYNIHNQFASPINLYEKPEDINLLELFYCEGTTDFSDTELKAASGIGNREDLPFPIYKLTTGDIDRILTQYLGLTLEQTNKVGLEHFVYLPDYDAYYLAHGDTNYCSYIPFFQGTREGEIVTLYQDRYVAGDWHCVTLEEQEDGSYHFLSNQPCERPAIPTPMPAGEPEAVIPLSDLESYEPLTLMEPERVSADTIGEILCDRILADGTQVLCYWESDHLTNPEHEYTKYWAISQGDGFLRFCREESGYTSGYRVSAFEHVLGRSGFAIECPRGAGYFARDYYVFDENGIPRLLADCANDVMEADLDGDGEEELLFGDYNGGAEVVVYLRRDDGAICRADLRGLVLDACDAMIYWDSCVLDRWSKCFSVSGVGNLEDGTDLRNMTRNLYFDGTSLLLYKAEKPWHDHMVDGADRDVPEAVVSAARECVEREIIVGRMDGEGDIWRYTNNQEDDGRPQERYDDWRIESFLYRGSQIIGDVKLEIWTFNYELHTIDPENVVLAGGKYLTEDDWVSPGYPGCDWLFFQVHGGDYTLLWHSMINDMTPGDELFEEYVQEHLAQLD